MKAPTERESRGSGGQAAALRHTRILCLAAFLTAMSFLLGYIAKTIQGTGPLRFTLEGLPIVLSGMVLGPLYGALTGLAADLLSCLLAGQAPLPLVSVGAAAVGLVPGLLSLLLPPMKDGKPSILRMLLFSGPAHLIGSMLIKTLALAELYGPLPVLLLRIPLYLVIPLIESALLRLLLGSPAVKRELERLVKK